MGVAIDFWVRERVVLNLFAVYITVIPMAALVASVIHNTMIPIFALVATEFGRRWLVSSVRNSLPSRADARHRRRRCLLRGPTTGAATLVAMRVARTEERR